MFKSQKIYEDENLVKFYGIFYKRDSIQKSLLLQVFSRGIIFNRVEVPGMNYDAILSCFSNGVEVHYKK